MSSDITTHKEIWKDIPGYEGLYQVSSHGRVMILKSPRKIMAQSLKGKPSKQYFGVTLTKNKKQKTFTVHRLVALAFIGEKPKGTEINHIDLNKLNNHLTNLEYVTHKRNMRHAVENNAWGSPTKDDRFEIIDLIKMGYTREQIAEWYSISVQMVKTIWRKRNTYNVLTDFVPEITT